MVLCLGVHFHVYYLWFSSVFIVFTICFDVVDGLVVGKCGNKKKKEEIGNVITLLELLFK
jgi:hypothetical protein